MCIRDSCSKSWCVSFDFHKSSSTPGQKCDLSDMRAEDVGGLKTDYAGDPYDHYSLATPGETYAVTSPGCVDNNNLVIYNAKTMRSAKENEVKDILTWLCCFMDGEAAWEKRKNSLSKGALQRPMNKAIREMVAVSYTHLTLPTKA